MPIYEYVCEKCGNKFEELTLSMNSKTNVDCPKCGGASSRQVSEFAAHSNTSSSSSCQMPDGSCGMTGGGCSGGGCPFGG